MTHYAVMAIGADRPGILAAVTEALYGLGANLEDASSTILRGHFASMLVVDAPGGVDRARIETTLAEAVRDLGVEVLVREAEGAPSRAQATHVLVAYAPDRPGIVATLARILADRGANVTRVSSRVVSPEEPVYTFVAEVDLPDGADPEELGRALDEAGRSLGVDVTFRPVDTETF
jgi:glycine cleavage system transcriptional repressor